MSERILVTGATGKVGGEVVRLLSERDREVKAATRRPDRARERLGEAFEVVELDYDRADTYDAAVEWADRLFLVPPPFDPRAWEHLASFLDWAVQAGCGQVVVLSAMGVEERDDVPLRRVELHTAETGVGHTFLRPNVYMQNFHPGFLAREIREEGTFHLPTDDARVSLVDARDVAAVAAEVLCDDAHDHDGKAYTLTGPAALDHYRVAEILSEVTGREVRYVPTDDEAWAARLGEHGWADDRVAVVLEFFRAIREGERATVTDEVPTLLGRTAGTFEAYAHEHAGAWRA